MNEYQKTSMTSSSYVWCLNREARYYGDAGAQYNLSKIYFVGRMNIIKDEKIGMYWLVTSAMNGCNRAQFDLGKKYFKGDGIALDKTKAAFWIEKAANDGYWVAQFAIGKMYQKGDGVCKNDKTAVAWFEKAALQGHPHAQTLLGEKYLKDGAPE